MSKESKLRLCPCCGGVDEYYMEPIAEQNDDGDRRVRCQCCDLATQWVSPKEDYTAEQLWNRRVIEDAQAARIAELLRVNDELRECLEDVHRWLCYQPTGLSQNTTPTSSEMMTKIELILIMARKAEKALEASK